MTEQTELLYFLDYAIAQGAKLVLTRAAFQVVRKGQQYHCKATLVLPKGGSICAVGPTPDCAKRNLNTYLSLH